MKHESNFGSSFGPFFRFFAQLIMLLRNLNTADPRPQAPITISQRGILLWMIHWSLFKMPIINMATCSMEKMAKMMVKNTKKRKIDEKKLSSALEL